MYENKKVLLIAGGGTLGSYVSQELLRLGASVDVICLEDLTSDNPKLRFFKNMATYEFLQEHFSQNHYDGIVNFIHYSKVEDYKKIHPLLIKNTNHLIFLSSYRVYANEQHPITENAPRLTDVLKDEEFFQNETYAYPKALCEDYLTSERKGENWTIVRPVISFSQRRLDLLMYSGSRVVNNAQSGEELVLPSMVKDYSAGLDWAGNSGKLIAHLLFKPEAIGEAFTVYSGHNLTWDNIAKIYEKLIGLKVKYTDEKEFLDYNAHSLSANQWWKWGWFYDRKFNRDIDCSKILSVTKLSQSDFTPIEDGIKIELKNLGIEIK